MKRLQKPLLFDHALMRFTYLVASVACFIGPALSAQQRGQGPPPLVKENATAKVADHVYVIPDNSVPVVPNVGIVVGNKSTLVIDTGLGPRNA